MVVRPERMILPREVLPVETVTAADLLQYVGLAVGGLLVLFLLLGVLVALERAGGRS